MPARTLPNLALQAFFDLGEDGWNDEVDGNFTKLSVLVQGGFIDKVSATPESPADGDVYVFADDHPTNANAIALYDVDTWKYFSPSEGWLLYNRGADYYEKFDGAAWSELATGGSGGIEEAPEDGKLYGRQDAAWAEIVAAEGGGSAGSGPGDGWIDLTFGQSEQLHGRTLYRSGENFDLAAGDRLEVRAYPYRSNGASASVGITTGANAHLVAAQDDGNIVFYQNSGGGDTARGAAGGGSNPQYNGPIPIMFAAIAQSASVTRMAASVDLLGLKANASTIGAIGSNKVLVETPDIQKTRVQARIVRQADVFSGGGSAPAPVVTVPDAISDLTKAQTGSYLRFTAPAAKTLNIRPQSAEVLPANGEWNMRNASASNMTLAPGAGVTLNPPFQGSLVVPPGGTITLKRVAVDVFDILGQTVPA